MQCVVWQKVCLCFLQSYYVCWVPSDVWVFLLACRPLGGLNVGWLLGGYSRTEILVLFDIKEKD